VIAGSRHQSHCLLPTKQKSRFERARQAIAAGDQAGVRTLLHQLVTQQTPSEVLSAILTDAVVATASARPDAETLERYRRTQRELDDWLRFAPARA
jgi:hypothetical protein